MAEWLIDRPQANMRVDTNNDIDETALANTPAGLEDGSVTAVDLASTSTTVSYNSNENDEMQGLMRIETSGATILAAADAGGTHQELSPPRNTAGDIATAAISFDYVNTGASKADWDDAVFSYQQLIIKDMGPDGCTISFDLVTDNITVTYTPASPPVLDTPTEADITSSTVTVGCGTDDPGNGDGYYYISESATAPSKPDLKDGTSSVKFGTTSNPTDPQTYAVTGLDADTDFYTYFLQSNAGGDSDILESGIWTTLEAPSGQLMGSQAGQGGLAGAGGIAGNHGGIAG